MTVPLAGLAGARLAGVDGHPALSMANAGTPFVYLPAWAAFAVGVAARRPVLATVAASVSAAHAVWTAPELSGPRPLPAAAAGAPRLRVVSSNIRYPLEDSTALGEELASAGADVLLLQELSPEHVRMIKASGALDPFAYSYVDARHGSFGSGIWSRYPLSKAETWAPGGLPMTRAVLDVEGRAVRVYNVHCKAPMRRRWVPVWKVQLAEIRAEVEASVLPAVVAGDFNATYGHAPFRHLLAGGLRDAHVEAGRGLATTWPRGGRPFPALFRVDHVLVTAGLAVEAAREGRGPGSDHRPVIADLVVTAHPAGLAE